MRVYVILALLILAVGPTSAQAQGKRAIPTDEGFNIDITWFDATKCASGDKQKFYFKVGDKKYGVAVGNIGHATLKRVDVLKPAGSGKSLEATVPESSGCYSEPLDLLKAEVAAGVDDLPKWLVVSETAERPSGPSLVAKYIQFLASKGQCKSTAKPHVVTCFGSKTVGSEKVGIVILVLTQPDCRVELLEYGSPIHARCEEFKGKMLPCLLAADISHATEIKGSIDMAAISADVLRKRHAALIRFATSIVAD